MSAAKQWLLREDALRLTGWSARHLNRLVHDGKLTARPSEQKTANGRRVCEISIDSLPAEIQRRLAAPLSIAQSSKFSQAISPFAEPKAAFANAEEEAQARERFSILEPLLTFALERSRYAQLQLANGSPVNSASRMAKFLSKKHGIGEATIWRWHRRYFHGREDGAKGLVALADAPRKDKGTSRFFDKYEAAAFVVASKYWEGTGISASMAHRALLENLDTLNIPREEGPSYETVRAFLASLPQAPAILARKGEKRFNEECLPYLKRAYVDVPANKIWVSDHMNCDVLVWDDCFQRDGTTFRPRLTMLLDWRSRKAVGYTFCLEGSSWTITTAVRNAILRYGPCQIFYCDNGKDYKKVARDEEIDRVKGLLPHLGITVQHCLPYHPQSKHIERSFRTNHAQFDAAFVAGYTTGNAYDRPDSTNLAVREHTRLVKLGQVERSPLVPASVYIELFVAWLEREYNNAPHTGTGMNGRSPNQVYDEQYPEALRPRLELADVAHLFYERERRIVDSCAVTLNRQRYVGATAEAANALLLRARAYLQIAYDKNDPSVAVALDDSGRLIAPLRLESLLPQSADAQPMIADSMAQRRRMQKSVTGLVRGVTHVARQLGVGTERQRLEASAGLTAAESSTALSIITHRAAAVATDTQPSLERPCSEDIGERLAAQLRRSNGTPH